jgi:hypothetical protein
MKRARFVRLAVPSLMLPVFLSLAVCAQTVVCPTDLGSRGLQSAIDEVPAGGVLILQAGVYTANAVVVAPITILGVPGVVLQPQDPSRAVITVRNTRDVSIRGLTINHAPVGVEISAASCTIAECSINTSGIGVEFFSIGSHVIVVRDCTVRGQGVGVQMVGAGTALLSNCRIEATGPGILVGGLTTLVAVGCTISRCYDGIVASSGADVFLHANVLQANMGSGIRLAALPPEAESLADGTLCAVDNRILDNVHWGIVYTTFDGTDCGVPNRQVAGAGNTLTGNGNGIACPPDLIPIGFLRGQEPE